jgi:acyl-CoA synthetase (AMP-forming)/AMP-acid ligase II
VDGGQVGAAAHRLEARGGRDPVAHVARRAEATAEQLLAWVAGRVAPFKRLHDVRFVDRVPRSPTGKLLRRSLVEAERAGGVREAAMA